MNFRKLNVYFVSGGNIRRYCFADANSEEELYRLSRQIHCDCEKIGEDLGFADVASTIVNHVNQGRGPAEVWGLHEGPLTKREIEEVSRLIADGAKAAGCEIQKAPMLKVRPTDCPEWKRSNLPAEFWAPPKIGKPKPHTLN